MKIIPVIDVKDGQVVRAVAGRRDEYRPVISQLTDSTDPETVATALLRATRADALYVADLDAITGKERGARNEGQGTYFTSSSLTPRPSSLRSVWLDAGVRTADDVARVAEITDVVVIGSETAEGPDVLREAVMRFGTDRVIFSLDLKDGDPLGWGESMVPLEVVHIAVEMGIRRLILLDLADVGVGAGTRTESLCSRIATDYPDLELIAGGGVRNRGDLDRLANVGVSAVLVATALHSGDLP